jgi:hypothetical protein
MGTMDGVNAIDVHGAGCQRSDPKDGDPDEYPNLGNGPQGDTQRVFNYVRLVRDAAYDIGGDTGNLSDTDDDGTVDDLDGCPYDPDKVSSGACGCGSVDADTDQDGTLDCIDDCPNDPDKTGFGSCGCGVSDMDSDNDGSADCLDGCPNDPNKTDPGSCGCNAADTDSDNDGIPDCFDECPSDPDKVDPGNCGCGISDIDSDGDGTPDCLESEIDAMNVIVLPAQMRVGLSRTIRIFVADENGNQLSGVSVTLSGCGVSESAIAFNGIARFLNIVPSNPGEIMVKISKQGVADVLDSIIVNPSGRPGRPRR